MAACSHTHLANYVRPRGGTARLPSRCPSDSPGSPRSQAYLTPDNLAPIAAVGRPVRAQCIQTQKEKRWRLVDLHTTSRTLNIRHLHRRVCTHAESRPGAHPRRRRRRCCLGQLLDLDGCRLPACRSTGVGLWACSASRRRAPTMRSLSSTFSASCSSWLRTRCNPNRCRGLPTSRQLLLLRPAPRCSSPRAPGSSRSRR